VNARRCNNRLAVRPTDLMDKRTAHLACKRGQTHGEPSESRRARSDHHHRQRLQVSVAGLNDKARYSRAGTGAGASLTASPPSLTLEDERAALHYATRLGLSADMQ
jgi:hypothetical protein